MSAEGGQDRRSWRKQFVLLAALSCSAVVCGLAAPSVLKALAQTGATTASNPTGDPIAALARISDYEKARWHPLHFPPAIATATNEQCLACHKEILSNKVRPTAPAGVSAATSLAWYQTLDTYSGDQQSFHARHLATPYANEVMNLSCNFCHRGHDPREEAPGSSATTAKVGEVTLRKQVDPQATCLLCHGRFPNEVMEGLDQPWPAMRANFETADQPNGCLTCHAETYRTVRHQVKYLKADNIEKLAKSSSDVCYGCHGGRAWYRLSYAYPRHRWPDMPKKIPAWAKSRPTTSDARYSLPAPPAQ